MEAQLVVTGAARDASESRAGEGLKRGGGRLLRSFGAHRFSRSQSDFPALHAPRFRGDSARCLCRACKHSSRLCLQVRHLGAISSTQTLARPASPPFLQLVPPVLRKCPGVGFFRTALGGRVLQCGSGQSGAGRIWATGAVGQGPWGVSERSRPAIRRSCRSVAVRFGPVPPSPVADFQ